MPEIQRLVDSEKHNFDVSWGRIGDSGTLIEDVIELYQLLAELIRHSGIQPKDDVVAPSMFLLACRYHLTMAVAACLRGHLNDSHYFSRKAIELSAFAYRTWKNPQLAMKWLQSWHNLTAYQEFKKEFTSKKLFPKDHSLLQQLYGRYDFSSKMVHSSVFSFGGHIAVSHSDSVFEFTFGYSALTDDDHSEPIGAFLWTIDTHFEILRLFEEIFATALASDKSKWDIRRNAVDGKIAVHKLKWKNIILAT